MTLSWNNSVTTLVRKVCAAKFSGFLHDLLPFYRSKISFAEADSQKKYKTFRKFSNFDLKCQENFEKSRSSYVATLCWAKFTMTYFYFLTGAYRIQVFYEVIYFVSPSLVLAILKNMWCFFGMFLTYLILT